MSGEDREWAGIRVGEKIYLPENEGKHEWYSYPFPKPPPHTLIPNPDHIPYTYNPTTYFNRNHLI